MNDSAFHFGFEHDRYPDEWQHINGETLSENKIIDVDIAIIGSGAGAGISAETLVNAGFKIAIIEEGPLRTAKDFKMREAQAYADLYQESAARKTKDKAINILQGRSVGGSTTVNWTSSFRTPSATLEHWQSVYGVAHHSRAELDPYFDRIGARLGIEPWSVQPNANNQLLAEGCQQLGWSHRVIARNVRGCANLGYCGMGCPMNAKQSMLVTTIPYALSHGAILLSRLGVERLVADGHRVVMAETIARDAFGRRRGVGVTVRAQHFVVAAGAIGSPSLLLRSTLKQLHPATGKRTFLHPVAVSMAVFKEEILAWNGAPQSIYSDHFLFRDGPTGAAGYKLEVPPIHPVLGAVQLQQHGAEHQRLMQQLKNIQATIALLRDGFHEHSVGGTVTLDKWNDPVIDYPISDYIWRGLQDALLSMAELQFAAGAEAVLPLHKDAQMYHSWRDARIAINALPMKALRMQVVSAHVMGGCAMGENDEHCVTDSWGRLRGYDNVSVHDGSLFPTSLGVNPQYTIYGLTLRLSEALVQRLKPTST